MKIDFKKELKEFYNPSAKDVSLVDLPQMNFLMIDGEGAPESSAFREAIEAIYPIAYGIKFANKKATGTDYGVMPLEGLWWADDMSAFNEDKRNKDDWKWTLMIMQPDFISAELFGETKKAAMAKKPNPVMEKVRLQKFQEGQSVQIMHVGPFSEEGPNIQKLHAKISDLGASLSGKHHEIYLNDFRRVNPQKMKTILRQPYQK